MTISKTSTIDDVDVAYEKGGGKALNETEALSRKRVLRKLDKHLLPLISVLYLFSFLDRANVGNAKVAGMAVDLKLVGLEFNIIAAVFFVTYGLFEVPSNIILKVVRPSVWIPSIMFAWGTVMTLMCLCNSFTAMVIGRVFLGFTEAGFFPGVTYYLSLWYPRSKQATRISLFFSAAGMAGAFGGLLAFGIEKMEGIGKLRGWQWIFCLEGLATVVFATVAFFIMHDYPQTATFLKEDERALVSAMLAEEDRLSTRFDKKFIWQALGDYKTWIQAVSTLGILIPVYSIALFTPVIVKELGFSAANAQLLSIPPFVLGCICTITVGITSDRIKRRGIFIGSGALISFIGFIVLETQTKPGVAYVGACIAAMGAYPMLPPHIAWSGGNAGGTLKRGVVLAMVVGTGNLGGICSSFIYFKPPRFHAGHRTNMGLLCMTMVLSTIAQLNYRRLNKKKIELCKRDGIDESQAEQFQDMGDESPLFRYSI